mmetsp:Transcript_30710/g.57504  ORF Transcript_30710/g.57504 Transcript_30710/m.57504 type:complete len:179 (-) Transcript_30710:272-808(-)
MKTAAALFELARPGGRASSKEKWICRCYGCFVMLLMATGVIFIVMGSMKELTISEQSDYWTLDWTFDSQGKGLFALTIGVAVTIVTVFVCLKPLCLAQCESDDLTHAWWQECVKCTRCCRTKCCCCCAICCNCCDYYCCPKRGTHEPTSPPQPYAPRPDWYDTPEMPEMVEIGNPATL